MVQVRRLAALCALAALLPTALPARAGTPAWVSTVPIETGAQERVETAPDGSAWAVIDHSRVMRSTDRGTTWLPVNPVPVSGLGLPASGPELGGSSDTSVAPVSALVALGGNAHAFSRTVDGGSTWQHVDVPSVTTPAGSDGTDLLRRTGSRFWLAPGGFDIVNGCATPLRTTPLLSSPDGSRWTRTDLPVRSGLVHDLRFRDARVGAVSVYDYRFTKVNDSSGCGYSGESGSTVVYVTTDGGRTWRRSTLCPRTCTLAWTRSGVLTLAEYDGAIRDSYDVGRTFRRTASLPSLPQKVLGLQSLDCSGERCWALVNGGGIWRRDRGSEWTEEASDADAPGVCVATIAAIDTTHAVAAGPHALMSRTEAGAATGGVSAAPVSSRVRLGPGVVRDGATVRVDVRR